MCVSGHVEIKNFRLRNPLPRLLHSVTTSAYIWQEVGTVLRFFLSRFRLGATNLPILIQVSTVDWLIDWRTLTGCILIVFKVSRFHRMTSAIQGRFVSFSFLMDDKESISEASIFPSLHFAYISTLRIMLVTAG